MTQPKAERKIKELKLLFYKKQYVLLSLIFSLSVFNNQDAEAQQIYWADSVISFSSQKSEQFFSAKQILGAPDNYPELNFSLTAWNPTGESSSKSEFIKVSFAKEVLAKQIIVAENYNSGAIEKIYAYEASGKKNLIYLSPSEDYKTTGNIFITSTGKNALPILQLECIFYPYSENRPYQIDAIGISETEISKNNLVSQISYRNNSLSIKRLPNTVNSIYHEVVPLISADGKTLYFDRKDHPQNTGSERRDDIWYTTISEDSIYNEAINFSALNDKLPNYLCSISPDGNTIVLGNKLDASGRSVSGISITNKTDSGWSKPVGQEIQGFYNLSEHNEFYLNNEGTILLFTSNMNDTYGSRDIYVSFLHSENHWSKPINLGKKINTSKDEISPFLAADNKTLFFSTDGRPGFGMQDIYVSKRLDDSWQHWSEPLNLGSTINSPAWEAYFSIDAKGNAGYFCSSKFNNNIDIYKFELPDELKPDKLVSITGMITDRQTGKTIFADVFKIDDTTGEKTLIARADANQGYLFYMQPDDTISIYLSSNGYSGEKFTIVSGKNDLIKNAELIPLKEGTIIEMNNILFKPDMATLKDSSFIELDKIIKYLNENPQISIEVRGHTNGICDDAYCNTLSFNRAKTVAEYFISQGITKDRISYNGYGKTLPIADNSTASGRAKNQRVEFMITEIKQSNMH